MPAFSEIGEFLAPTLDLPLAGKLYSIPSPPAKVGLKLQAMFSVAGAVRQGKAPADRDVATLSDAQETSLYQDALGPCYEQMLDDGVPYEALKHAALTAYLWIVAGEDSAAEYWARPQGEAPSPVAEG